MVNDNKIKTISKVILVLAAILLVTNVFLPIWQIELYAPQYPEGLELLIYADSLAGDVEIINGLNHYIGMATLHSENFVEFSILKYIFIFLSLCVLAVAIIGKKKPVYFLLFGFVLFGIIAMVDFYRWNYNYGHNLDPSAAIKVPGMSYQPPLIGYKQLLNFGAYSIPDTGGWLLITAGLLILVVVIIESGFANKILRKMNKAKLTGASIVLFAITSCSTPGPKPLEINKDMCAYCKMTITNAHFATQLITAKGRHYIFDDVICMVSYAKENGVSDANQFYVADFSEPSNFVDTDHARFLQSDSLRSPMGGNIAGFAASDSLQKYQSLFGGAEVEWTNLVQ